MQANTSDSGEKEVLVSAAAASSDENVQAGPQFVMRAASDLCEVKRNVYAMSVKKLAPCGQLMLTGQSEEKH